MVVTFSDCYYFGKQKLYFIFKVNPLDAASIKIQCVLKSVPAIGLNKFCRC